MNEAVRARNWLPWIGEIQSRGTASHPPSISVVNRTLHFPCVKEGGADTREPLGPHASFPGLEGPCEARVTDPGH